MLSIEEKERESEIKKITETLTGKLVTDKLKGTVKTNFLIENEDPEELAKRVLTRDPSLLDKAEAQAKRAKSIYCDLVSGAEELSNATADWIKEMREEEPELKFKKGYNSEAQEQKLEQRISKSTRDKLSSEFITKFKSTAANQPS